MINQGFEFMVIGVTVVFAFLILLVIVMDITHAVLKFINKFFPEVEEQKPSVVISANDAELAVAIAAAHSMKNN
ncbi:MAG: OadG family protein [Spirochaetes bacterium]|nr:OadG family protein [Spirochaetota bacterium]